MLIINEYTDWLMDKINIRTCLNYPKWIYLFREMNVIDYRWDDRIPRDEDRGNDGLYLRRGFLREFPDDETVDALRDKPCSVLEMLVAFAMRIEDDYIGNPSNPKPQIIFLRMVQNLGLDPAERLAKTDQRIQQWLDRSFESNGFGGIFPLPGTARDQRTVSYWSQMNEYVNNNYM